MAVRESVHIWASSTCKCRLKFLFVFGGWVFFTISYMHEFCFSLWKYLGMMIQKIIYIQIVINFYSVYVEMWIDMWIKQLYSVNSSIYSFKAYMSKGWQCKNGDLMKNKPVSYGKKLCIALDECLNPPPDLACASRADGSHLHFQISWWASGLHLGKKMSF